MTNDYDNYWEEEYEWDDRTEQIKLDAQEYEGDDGYDYEDEEQEDGEDD